MQIKHASVSLAALCGVATMLAGASVKQPAVCAGYIVQGTNAESAAQAVRSAGGRITHELPIIEGVSALLTPQQVARLRRNSHLTLFADAPVTTQASAASTSKGTSPARVDVYQRAIMGVNTLASEGINGAGVTIAVLDSGILQPASLLRYSPYSSVDISSFLGNDLNGNPRLLAQYDAINSIVVDATHPWVSSVNDSYGHGTHITSLMLSSFIWDLYQDYEPQGVAPDARLISVKAFNGQGVGTYANVINGLNWIYANRNTYGHIGVVNLSFGAPPQSYYWNDPIDQAVMKLWQAGIVVVASAGNYGPNPMTITVPGNTPYVITVGAMTDDWQPNKPSNDGVTSFSSAGPTYEGFVKPEIIAPGGHLSGLMNKSVQYLAATYPQFTSVDLLTFEMSGTSQAAALTSGVVALMLQANPTLTPDQLKCQLLSSATALVGKKGEATYSVFQQGAGLVNANAAVQSQAANCANIGLNINNDIAGTAHYGGPARQNPTTGQFYVVDANGNPLAEDGYTWNQQYAENQGYTWSQGYLWNNGSLLNTSYLWNNGFLWNEGYLWNQSTITPASSPMNSESWNDQE
jgi:serine protease AprX